MNKFKRDFEHFIVTLLTIFNVSLNVIFAGLIVYSLIYLICLMFGIDFIITDILNLQRKNNGIY